MRVLSYNILEGGGNRLERIAAVIQGQQPDAVAILEASSRANVEWLARDLGLHLAFGEANGPCHVAWLSRLPAAKMHNHRLPALSKTLLEIEVPWEGTHLHLFATHLASRHDTTTPEQEIPAILDVLRPLALAETPHLLVGDFNALAPGDIVGPLTPGVEKRGDAVDGAPRPAIRSVLEAGYVDCYRAVHKDQPGNTYPADSPWLRLDFIFASRVMSSRLSGCDVVTGSEVEQASDHLPIWAGFR